ncbi:MAG: hypothetical protein HY939_05835 [Gammaproteobacteria bacterium]|nr:hypothetical protein [Gammaproteobacteria bacterium]
MKPIILKNEHDEICGLLVRPSEGTSLTSAELNRLKPYIDYVVKISSNHDTYPTLVREKLRVSDKDGTACLGFSDLSAVEQANLGKILRNIVEACSDHLSEQIIVPQNMGQGPAIRHRPLYFEANTSEGTINVKYTTLGDFNNFDVAMDNLKRIYPTVTPFVASKVEEAVAAVSSLGLGSK